MNTKAMEQMMMPLLQMLEKALPDEKPTCEFCQLLEDAIDEIIGETRITKLIKQVLVSECERDPIGMHNKLQQVHARIGRILIATQPVDIYEE